MYYIYISMYNYFQEQYWKLAVFKSPGMTQITERIPMGIFGQKRKNNLYFATYNLLSARTTFNINH